MRPREAQPFTDLSDLETLPRGRVFAGTKRAKGRRTEKERKKKGGKKERTYAKTRLLTDFGESWRLQSDTFKVHVTIVESRGTLWVAEGAKRKEGAGALRG